VTFIAALFLGLGIVAVSYGIMLRGNARQQKLQELLEVEMMEPSRSPEALNDLVQRAGELADRAFGDTSVATRVKTSLNQAGLKLKPGEFAAILPVVSIGAAAVFGLVFRSAMVAAVVAGVTPMFITFYVSAKGRRRIQKIENQLPSMLQLLAGSLDSGASLLLALELAGTEGDPPLAPELNRIVAETRVGRPLIEAMEAMAERIGSSDIAWTVEAIRIQQATGGKLADTLRVLADFMRTRLEVKGEVRALSAEARISGKVLIALPIGIGLFEFLFRHDYIKPLFTTWGGKVMVSMAVGGIILGSIWMKRLGKVEV
jgi:tight adherence protein B